MKKGIVVTFLSLVAGYALFVLVIKIAGLENVLSAFKDFSPRYFLLFTAVTFAIWLATTYRWKAILSGEEISVNFWTLLRYQFVVFGINYLTPAGRLGGEPLKVLLLKKQHIKSSKSFASIVIDNFVGRGFDTVVAGVVLILLVFISTGFSRQVKEFFLLIGLASFGLVTAIYLVLAKKKSVFTYALQVVGNLTRSRRKKLFVNFYEKVARAEFYMRELLTKRPKSLFLALFYAAFSWPLTLLQYKLALLMLGVDAPLFQILLSIVVFSFTASIPIPASLGVQEAGQFSAFKLISANPHTGIALSLVLRLKDIIALLISFVLLSREGINLFALINKKLSAAGNKNNKKGKGKKEKKKISRLMRGNNKKLTKKAVK